MAKQALSRVELSCLLLVEHTDELVLLGGIFSVAACQVRHLCELE
jgi:hypothetical protein